MLSRRQRKGRRKMEIAQKEFFYRGKSVEELLKMPLDELINLLPSRARRTLKRGLTREQDKLVRDVKKAEDGEIIKTHCRNMIILPSFIGKTIGVYNGKEFQPVRIQPEMVGHYLGEFALTRKRVKHSGPGVGATRSSKYMPLK
ncbi:MAG TPA: 30S ribosomal protein S19 [Thermoplasmatales archaeon]|nr:30S ribosomal protein S19 [Thermoplasmata archaeon]RLF46002.1 MAG: 30S ribosomal protein S19 [Thermoplasmata archaeon]HEB37068.1 30S ribosomal protein S19 [Thermoplasmatales archaeon]